MKLHVTQAGDLFFNPPWRVNNRLWNAYLHSSLLYFDVARYRESRIDREQQIACSIAFKKISFSLEIVQGSHGFIVYNKDYKERYKPNPLKIFTQDDFQNNFVNYPHILIVGQVPFGIKENEFEIKLYQEPLSVMQWFSLWLDKQEA